MSTHFVLQPAESELQMLADQYWETSGNRERELEREAFEAGAAIRDGEFTLANLEAIVRWKAQREVLYLITNGDGAIRRALEIAVSPGASTESAMRALLALRGIDVPMASAILSAIFPEHYIELDYEDLEALGQRRRDIHYYEDYLAYCRELANRGLVQTQGDLPGPTPLRALDRALTQWARNHPE